MPYALHGPLLAVLKSCNFGAIFVVAGVLAFPSCTRKQHSGSAQESMGELITRGKRSYLVNCTACHNSDPGKDGPIGPAVHGASLDLIRARVLEAKYPSGYKPKRETHTMAALPHLKGDIEALHAFLNQ